LIDFSGLPNFQAFPHEICHSSLIDLQNIKTQKLTKTLENNKAKGLTNANQGVQIHNIWHSSATMVNTQAIAKMEVQIGQITNHLCEREKGKLPSQPVLNPKV
jgi:hypothetical protein